MRILNVKETMEGSIVYMNVKEKLIINIIQRLIDNKSFEIAIKKINMLIPTTTCIRKCVNLKVQCLLELGNYHDAYELYKDYFPYVMVDTEDLIAINYLSKIHQYFGNKIQANKYENSYKIISGTKEERNLFLCVQEEKSYCVYNKFLINDDYTKETLGNIIIDNFQMLRITETVVYLALAQHLRIDISNDIIEAFSHYTQAKKFKDELLAGNRNKYCLISEHSNQSSMLRERCLVKALSRLGVIIYHIVPYYESGSETFSINKCFELQVREGNIITIRIPKTEARVEIGFLSDMIKFLNDQNDTGDPIVLFGNSDLLMELNEDVEISKIFEMYFRHYEIQPIARMDCLLLGSYLSSISYIWGFDVKKEFLKEPECDFSIIIPVRNSIKYLSETIETCLDQDFEGTYEILVSDNSCDNNVKVEDFVNSIRNPHIRYIRTPFDLSLSKSFEFAYLNSHGRYLISLGSDDGLIKTALSMMYNAIQQYPDNNVFVWNHALYYWPDYPNDDVANKIIINYILNDNTKTKEFLTEPFIKKFSLSNISYLYMPNMYLVSCVRRKHINKILEFTGKFEDGDSQDLYTGMLNLFLEDKITYIDYPLVIAGNSEVGVGLLSEQSIQSMEFLGRRFRSLYTYYRYRNYYFQEFRNLCPILGSGAELLLYREFVKVIRYNIKKDCREKDDIIRILYKLHNNWLPEKYCDEAVYLKQLENIAKVFGEDVFTQYISNRIKWNMELHIKRMIIRMIKNTTLRNNLRKIYYSTIKLHDIMSNNVEINCKEHHIQGVKSVAEYLAKEI